MELIYINFDINFDINLQCERGLNTDERQLNRQRHHLSLRRYSVLGRETGQHSRTDCAYGDRPMPAAVAAVWRPLVASCTPGFHGTLQDGRRRRRRRKTGGNAVRGKDASRLLRNKCDSDKLSLASLLTAALSDCDEYSRAAPAAAEMSAKRHRLALSRTHA